MLQGAAHLRQAPDMSGFPERAKHLQDCNEGAELPLIGSGTIIFGPAAEIISVKAQWSQVLSSGPMAWGLVPSVLQEDIQHCCHSPRADPAACRSAAPVDRSAMYFTCDIGYCPGAVSGFIKRSFTYSRGLYVCVRSFDRAFLLLWPVRTCTRAAVADAGSDGRSCR